MGIPPNRFDVLVSIEAVHFANAWQKRLRGTLGGVSVYFLARQDLLRNEKAAGRPQDLLDVEMLCIFAKNTRRAKRKR